MYLIHTYIKIYTESEKDDTTVLFSGRGGSGAVEAWTTKEDIFPWKFLQEQMLDIDTNNFVYKEPCFLLF